MLLLWSADFFQNSLFQKSFHEHYRGVKRFASRSELTKLFAKVISRRQKTALCCVLKQNNLSSVISAVSN